MKFKDLLTVLDPHDPILFGKALKNLSSAKQLQISIRRGKRSPQKVRGVSSVTIHEILNKLPPLNCVTAIHEHSITLNVEFEINKQAVPSCLTVTITECTHPNFLEPSIEVRNHNWLSKNCKSMHIGECVINREVVL